MLRLIDYWHSLSRETREGGDLHRRLLHWCRRPCTRRHALKASDAFNISSEASCINDKRPSHYDQVPHYWCLLYYLLEIESKMQTTCGKVILRKMPLSYLKGIFLRCLAESNRSSRFCRPVPNRSAKAPFPFWDCKYMDFCRICKIYFN